MRYAYTSTSLKITSRSLPCQNYSRENYSDKPLFHTDTDISESLHNQVDEASNGEELLDSTEKQTESLLSNDDYVSETEK